MTIKKEEIDNQLHSDESIEKDEDVQDLCDWEHISNSEAAEAYTEDLSPPPDIMSDPFKERFANIKESYKKVSRYGNCHSYNLKAMMVKANDDCR